MDIHLQMVNVEIIMNVLQINIIIQSPVVVRTASQTVNYVLQVHHVYNVKMATFMMEILINVLYNVQQELTPKILLIIVWHVQLFANLVIIIINVTNAQMAIL